jgi:hypothetical protein
MIESFSFSTMIVYSMPLANFYSITAYSKCTNDMYCASETVRAYSRKYAKVGYSYEFVKLLLSSLFCH